MFAQPLLNAARFFRSPAAFALALVLAVGSCVAFPPASEVDLSSGREPPQRFFVLVVSAELKERISLGTFNSLSASLRNVKEYSFLLPNTEGAFSVGENIKISYRVESNSHDRQNVEVSYADEENVKVISRYEAQNRTVTPLYSKVSHPMMGIWYLAVAAAAWFVMWILASVGLSLHGRAMKRRAAQRER